MKVRAGDRLYGVLAEFGTPQQLIVAAGKTHDAGYRRIEAYSPYPIEGLSEALGHRVSRVPLLTLVGGIIGALGGYSLQYWTSVVAYPINVGGRPLNSAPAFIPVTFEMTILVAGLFAVLGMLALNGLPMPYHPVFNVPRFALASRDRYFLFIAARDKRFDPATARAFLHSLRPTEVSDVED